MSPALRPPALGQDANWHERLTSQALIGMTGYYGLSGRAAAPEHDPMTEAECERKIALLRAVWSTFHAAAARVSPELRKGPRGGG